MEAAISCAFVEAAILFTYGLFKNIIIFGLHVLRNNIKVVIIRQFSLYYGCILLNLATMIWI